jgi:putative ABC transport system permease protein
MGRVALLRLFRFPGVFAAVFGAATILGVVTAAGAPFVSSTASATLQRTIEADAAFRLPTLTVAADGSISSDLIAYRTGLLERELGPVLGAPIVTARGDTVTVSADGNVQPVRIVTRTGALDHVERIEGAGGEGVWLADVTATELGVEPGDRIGVGGVIGSTEVAVAGVYRDLMTSSRTPFWAPLDDFIYPPAGADTRPPAFMLMDLPTYVAVDDALLDDQDPFTWEFRLPERSTSIEEAQALRSQLARFRARLDSVNLDVGSAFPTGNLDEPYSGWLSSARQISDSVAGPVNALVLAARVLALLVLAGSGVFMMRRRRVELAVLNARGVGPVRLGGRTMAEVVLPVALGAFVGWAVALAAVDRLGPGGVVGEAVAREAGWNVAWTAAAGVALLAIVSARSLGELATAGTGSARRVASAVPWDLILLVLAGVAFAGLRGDSGAVAAGTVPELDPLFLLFPILLLAGAAGLLARGTRVLLPRLRQIGSGSRPGVYLALRRLAAAPKLAASLLVASAVAIGILVYSGTLSSSLAETAGQDASLAVGSDVAVDYSGSLSDASGIAVTPIVRLEGVTFASGSDADLDILLVDPVTFAEGAFWSEEFSDEPLETLMARLAEPVDGLPVLVAGSVRVPADPAITVGGVDVPIDVAGTARTFPGVVGARPLVVMDRGEMETALESRGLSLAQLADGLEVWGHGSEDELRDFVASAGATVLSSRSAEALRDTPRFLAVTSMLRFLQALGILASTVVLIAGYLYLQTRQRQAETSYALARRMGLSRASNRRSVALEVTTLLGTAFVIGGTIAAVASIVVNEDVQARAVDVAVPLFRLPIPLLSVTAAAVLLFAWVGAAFVQRRADRADVAEVMRVAE